VDGGGLAVHRAHDGVTPPPLSQLVGLDGEAPGTRRGSESNGRVRVLRSRLDGQRTSCCSSVAMGRWAPMCRCWRGGERRRPLVCRPARRTPVATPTSLSGCAASTVGTPSQRSPVMKEVGHSDLKLIETRYGHALKKRVRIESFGYALPSENGTSRIQVTSNPATTAATARSRRR
jgi:hypothetical protein